MKCEEARAQLTAYLDAELEGDRGSAVRGHLRGCEACRQAASDEAALRDGLRVLPPIDPPASLWAGVQARLAAAEVADAERPAWRRILARPRSWLVPQQLALAGAAIIALVALLVWKSHRDDPRPVVADQHVEIAPAHVESPPAPAPAPAPAPPCAVAPSDETDVTADLAAAPARATCELAASAQELAALADAARASWTDDRKREFDTRVAELRAKLDHADEGRPRQQAYRALIRYLQGAAVRDEVALR